MGQIVRLFQQHGSGVDSNEMALVRIGIDMRASPVVGIVGMDGSDIKGWRRRLCRGPGHRPAGCGAVAGGTVRVCAHIDIVAYWVTQTVAIALSLRPQRRSAIVLEPVWRCTWGAFMH